VPPMPRPRWYDNPIVWLGIQIGEWLVLRWVLLRLLPTTMGGSTVAAILIAALLVVVGGNYVWLRHLRARDEAG